MPFGQEDRRAAVLALLVCALCWLAAAAPASAASQDPAFGANAESLLDWSTFWAPTQQFPTPAPPVDPYLAALAADGVGVIRSDAPWVWVQPDQSSQLSDSSNWATLDMIVTELADNGLRWQPVIAEAPSWAAQTPNTPAGCAPVNPRYLPPQDPAQYAAFAAFAGAVAARYGPGGTFWTDNPTLTPLPVERYEIWNEENVDAYWNNAPSAAQYVPLYNAARTQILAVDSTAQVIVGGVAWGGQVDCVPSVTNDADYIEALFAAGGPGWAVDGIGVHPYGPAALNIVANLRREQQALQAAGRTDVPLEQTELGWPVRPAGAPAGSLAAGYADDASRAGTVALTSDIVMGSDCNVQSYDIYDAVDRESTLVSEDGQESPGVSPYDLEEHWFGIFALGATEGEIAPATMTSTAFAAAIARDEADDNAGQDIPVCAPVGAHGRLLTLTLSVAPTAQSGCFNATVTYLGLPVSGAEIRASAPIQPAGTTSFGPTFTDPDGVVGFCVAPGENPAVSAVVGGGSFDPNIVPLVATSNTIDVSGPPPLGPDTVTTTTTTTTPTQTAPPVASKPVVSPVPACILRGLRVSRERLATALSRGLRAQVALATVAKARGCLLSLSLSLRPGGRVVGALRVTVRRVGVTLVILRVGPTGRRELSRRRNPTLTLRLDVAGAPIGTGVLAEPVRLSG